MDFLSSTWAKQVRHIPSEGRDKSTRKDSMPEVSGVPSRARCVLLAVPHGTAPAQQLMQRACFHMDKLFSCNFSESWPSASSDGVLLLGMGLKSRSEQRCTGAGLFLAHVQQS